MRRDGKAVSTADSSALAGGGVCDAAVRKATGKGWGEWYDLLDAAGAREMTHQQIVAVVSRHERGGWWQQMITVAYERARGLRERHQKDDGFSATASKIIKAGVTRVFGAWTEDGARAPWLDATGWHVRKSTPYRSLRITWTDGKTHLDVYFWPRGLGKTLVQIEHSKLGSVEEVARLRTFWSEALEKLRELLETADEPHSLAA